jgi:hypothetical protein
MLNKLLKALGFRRKESLDGFLDRYDRLTPNQREAVLDLDDDPAFVGCLVPAKLIGVIEAEQNEDQDTLETIGLSQLPPILGLTPTSAS